MNFRRTRAIFRKELLHILRDPRSLVAALLQPLIMLLIFGWALSLDVDRIPTYVYDADQTPQSRELIRDFQGSRYFQVVEQVHSYAPIEQAIDKRQCLLGVVIPRDFARDLGLNKSAQVQLLVDGSDSNTAAIAINYAEAVVAVRSAQLQASIQTARVNAPNVDTQVRVWYNPNLLSQNFIVPGLIAVIVMIIAANLGSLTIAREWENGTMEQLLSTPARPMELALGKLAAYFVVGTADMLIALLVGVYVFNVPLEGSAVFLLVSSAVFLFGALGLGIMVSAMFRSQLMAYQMGTLLSFLPAFLLSGFIYPLGSMPRVIQLVSLIVPARYFMEIARGIFLKGIGLELLWFNFVLLVGYGVLVFYFATRKLRQKVA
ncbi:MAG TPA: ABC transporter permease [Bryobacteraceae bacterium]|jgi:ABC-2 type transport system permease protein|nr:ABC transporter permease [Bryobacteraceae bacterium]